MAAATAAVNDEQHASPSLLPAARAPGEYIVAQQRVQAMLGATRADTWDFPRLADWQDGSRCSLLSGCNEVK
jgi:hypothetical protein